jgi:hypothetical protein
MKISDIAMAKNTSKVIHESMKSIECWKKSNNVKKFNQIYNKIGFLIIIKNGRQRSGVKLNAVR